MSLVNVICSLLVHDTLLLFTSVCSALKDTSAGQWERKWWWHSQPADKGPRLMAGILNNLPSGQTTVTGEEVTDVRTFSERRTKVEKKAKS